MLPHPQPFFLHLHHIIFLVLWVVDLLQLEEGNKQMLAATLTLCICLLSACKKARRSLGTQRRAAFGRK